MLPETVIYCQKVTSTLFLFSFHFPLSLILITGSYINQLFQVFAGAKPLLDKTLGILVEGLIDTFLSLFDENGTNELRSLDTNGFCQLMLEVKFMFNIRKFLYIWDRRECSQVQIFRFSKNLGNSCVFEINKRSREFSLAVSQPIGFWSIIV